MSCMRVGRSHCALPWHDLISLQSVMIKYVTGALNNDSLPSVSRILNINSGISCTGTEQTPREAITVECHWGFSRVQTSVARYTNPLRTA